jgi:hypothetical protein
MGRGVRLCGVVLFAARASEIGHLGWDPDWDDFGTMGGSISVIRRNRTPAPQRHFEATMSGLAAARARGRNGGRKREVTPAQIRRAQKLYDARELTVSEIAKTIGCSRQTLYRYLDTSKSLSESA